MKCVVINKKFFNVGKPESYGLVSALDQLNKAGYDIACSDYDSVDESITGILRNEGIDLIRSTDIKCDNLCYIDEIEIEDERTIVINDKSGYNNLLDAAKVLTVINRSAIHQRNTKETSIEIELNLDGEGEAEISTGIGFFDHMLEQIARHGNIDLKIKVDGDLHVDEHHTVEDVGIALGETILNALGDKSGIKRYGYFLPMDDSIARVALDIGGRQYLNFKCKFSREFVGEFPTELTKEFFKGIAQGMKANVYIRAKGKNDHHKIEAVFKAFAKSLNEACRFDERAKGKLPSTKGII